MPNGLSALGVIALACSTSAAVAAKLPEGEARLAPMLQRYDTMRPGPERDRLALAIDEAAHQRYATISRLYWHTDLHAAQTAAHATRRPILHLRMLGRLDEDLSCANSRFFRTTLYANAEVSKFLRDNFVLYWSSERPVPRVTIDFGDGRKIERTTTGNSAHYVMDADGNVLDALPGLYAPVVFRSELAKSLALAKQVRGLERTARDAKIAAFHAAETQRTFERFAKVAANTPYIAGRRWLRGAGELGVSAIERAERASMAKMVVEAVDLARIGIDAGTIDPRDLEAWATIGQKLWNIGLAPDRPMTKVRAGRGAFYPAPLLLDAQSIALVRRVRAGNPLAMAPEALLARLEQHILADTAQNELRLRPLIRAQLGHGRAFDEINERVYRQVFHTPRSDVWLGLLEDTDFTGLPADGVVMP